MSPSETLFDPIHIPQSIASSLPEGYTLRPLRHSDRDAFLAVLRVLTTVGDISADGWTERYTWISQRSGEYFIIVIADGSDKPVAVGSLIVEKKFLRNLGCVGHIEDVSVAKDQQGKKLGLRIVQALDAIAQAQGCYKAILDCSEGNRPFYEKCGYKLAGVQMSHYYDGSTPKDAPKSQ